MTANDSFSILILPPLLLLRPSLLPLLFLLLASWLAGSSTTPPPSIAACVRKMRKVHQYCRKVTCDDLVGSQFQAAAAANATSASEAFAAAVKRVSSLPLPLLLMESSLRKVSSYQIVRCCC